MPAAISVLFTLIHVHVKRFGLSLHIGPDLNGSLPTGEFRDGCIARQQAAEKTNAGR